MAIKATKVFHARNPKTGRHEVFYPGNPVPEEVARLVSEDVIDKKPKPLEADATITVTPEELERLVAEKAGGKLYSQEELDEAVAQAIAETAQAAAQPDENDAPAYDPSAHNADDVKAHLDSLDVTDPAQAAEFARIVEAEKTGKNRSTALPAVD